MIVFWILSASLLAGALIWIVRPLIKTSVTPADDELEHARGLRDALDALDAEAGTDLSETGDFADDRRALARKIIASAQSGAAAMRISEAPSRTLAVSLAATLSLVVLALYLALGAPELADGSGKAELDERREYTALVDALAARLEREPGDAAIHRLLANSLSALRRFDEAVPHFRRVLTLGERDADTLTAFAQALALSGPGGVPEALAALDEALGLEPDRLDALFFRAEGRAAVGDADGALADWRRIAALAPAGSPLHEAAQARLAATGIAPPVAEESAAAAIAALPEAERGAAIEGMVARLAARLDTAPDDLDGWLRLINAYQVLGRLDDAEAARAKARAAFADDPDALAALAPSEAPPAP